MNLISLIYILLYIFSIYFGPHFITRIIRGDQLLILSSFEIFFKRIFYLSYITYLYNAFYFNYPNLETFLNTILINLSAILGYILKWYYLIRSNPFYLSGIIVHCITFIPVIISIFYFKLPYDYSFGFLSKFTLFFLLFYILFVNLIYSS